ncbi:SPOSA6832_04911, partial [Sporobolomyces salmonicolor]
MTASSASSATRTDSTDREVKDEKARSVQSASPEVLEQHELVIPVTDNLKTKETLSVRTRWWLKVPREPYPSLEQAEMTPLASANIFSKATFHWIQPLLTTGYQRTLVPTDLWKLQDDFQAGHLADVLMSNFEKRRAKVEAWNQSLEDGTYKPSAIRRTWWRLRRRDGRRKVGLAMALSDTFFWRFWLAGVLKVISDSLNVTSPLVTRALINYGTDAYYSHRSVPGYTEQPIGVGVGLAFGLFGMQIVSAFCLHHFFAGGAGTGVLARGALIASIYRKATVLSGKARTVMTNGRLVNHIASSSDSFSCRETGTDVSRVDFCAGFFHMSWTAPIQVIIILIILLVQIGPSCLAGVGFLFVMIPPQSIAMKKMFGFRRKAMLWTDKRARLIGELLGGMKVLKFFAWEVPYLEKLGGYRAKELHQVRALLVSRAATTGVAMSLPTLATVIAFIVYANTGHRQNAASIFTSFTLFQLLRMPLMMLPMSLSTITDALNALGRLTEVFLAEERSNAFEVDLKSELAISVKEAAFQWESPPPDTAPKSKKEQAKLASRLKGQKREAKKEARRKEQAAKVQLKLAENVPTDPEVAENSGDVTGNIPRVAQPAAMPDEEEKEVLQLRNINLSIPKGQLCAVVGSVGSGKSSLLQALVGEMKCTRGEIAFGGSISYAAQQAWMQSCSLKHSTASQDNILFGRPYNEVRYKQVIHDACLEADIEMLPYGDATDIGEKVVPFWGQKLTISRRGQGVTLSGGQKQRVNIARTLYYDADIVLLDDPLSAVDAHVGKHLFEKAICGSLAGKTRILVTHALHFLPRVDYIICLDHGKIMQEGTYASLVADKDGAFSALMEEFGGDLEEKKEEKDEAEEEAIEGEGDTGKKQGDKPKTKGLMQEEERATGSVSKAVYGQIFRLANGWVTFTLLLLSVILQQGAQVVGSYFLVWWQDDPTDLGYMSAPDEGMYAMLGVLQAIFAFFMGEQCHSPAPPWIGYNVSKALHQAAIQGVLRAPMSFFDTTPQGRVSCLSFGATAALKLTRSFVSKIMNRFSKDIDTIDNILSDSFRMFISTASSVVGSIILIAIVQHWFLLVVAGVFCLYGFAASFYRQSARELKRLDNLLRSSLYAHFSETLSGLATVRAYGELPKFLKQNENYLDIENRAYYLTVINQRWLGLRLDIFGALLTFAVAMFSQATAKSISPAQTGLVLSYILTTVQACSWMVRQGVRTWILTCSLDLSMLCTGAEVENDMNSIERVLYYAHKLEAEAPAVIEDSRPPQDWPAQGAIKFKNVVMSYRPGLPPVLKGLSLSVGAGERIGVVGRTGAGKSSIMMTLFRIVELTSGEIEVDGIDISKIGLADLRKKMAIIPQDALLFNGTIRSNLDPFGEHDDATLYDAMKRAWLIDQDVPAPGSEAAVVAQDSEVQAPGASTPISSRFTLDLAVEDEGQNLSVGERSLVSLARALVKNSKIIVLDEATASVDFATDSRIQSTIRTEFKDKTLLIIAHRLRTIIDADRVLVMDQGNVAEYDTPLNLYRMGGIFRGMCERSGISEKDIAESKF